MLGVKLQYTKKILARADKIASPTHRHSRFLCGIDFKPSTDQVRIRFLRQSLDHPIQDIARSDCVIHIPPDELREALIANHLVRRVFKSRLIRLPCSLEFVQSGLRGAELLPQCRLGREGLEQAFRMSHGVGVTTQHETQCQCLAPDRIAVGIEPENPIVEEEEFRLPARGRRSLGKQPREFHLRFDIVRVKFEILPQVVDREINFAGFRGVFRLKLERSGDSPRLYRMDTEKDSDRREDDEEDFEEKSLVDCRHSSRVRANSTMGKGPVPLGNSWSRNGTGGKSRDSTPTGVNHRIHLQSLPAARDWRWILLSPNWQKKKPPCRSTAESKA